MTFRFWLRTLFALCLIVCMSGYTLAGAFSLLARLTGGSAAQAPACAQRLPAPPPHAPGAVELAYFGKPAQ